MTPKGQNVPRELLAGGHGAAGYAPEIMAPDNDCIPLYTHCSSRHMSRVTGRGRKRGMKRRALYGAVLVCRALPAASAQ
jgi:hypothetical protein